MTRLVLTRHGQSQWNLENRFTGWVDVDLTERGEAEARRGGTLMRQAGFAPDIAFTSYLRRAIRTAHLGLDTLDRLWVPLLPDWRLNERHYGALTGLDKAETVAAHGEEQVLVWRRSFDIPPPALERTDPRHPVHEERYAHLDPAVLPGTESLKDTLERVDECFRALVAPRLLGGESVFISAHGNSLRALVKILFQVSDSDILKVEVPTGNPLLIELDGLRPLEARYLDTDRAEALPPCPKG